jgi:hypothetical protein
MPLTPASKGPDVDRQIHVHSPGNGAGNAGDVVGVDVIQQTSCLRRRLPQQHIQGGAGVAVAAIGIDDDRDVGGVFGDGAEALFVQ